MSPVREQPDAPYGDGKDQARVILSLGGVHARRADEWTEDLPRHRAELSRRARRRGAHPDAASPGKVSDVVRLRGGFCQRTDPDLADGSPRQPAEAGDVVGVEVGQNDQRNPVDAELVEAAVDQDRVRTGVDQHGLTGPGRHHEGVALADRTRDEHPIGGWPPRLARRRHSPATIATAAEHSQRRASSMGMQPASHERDAEPDNAPAGCGPRPARAGECGTDVGDPDDRLGGPGRAESGERRKTAADQRETGSGEPEHGRRPTNGPASALVRVRTTLTLPARWPRPRGTVASARRAGR